MFSWPGSGGGFRARSRCISHVAVLARIRRSQVLTREKHPKRHPPDLPSWKHSRLSPSPLHSVGYIASPPMHTIPLFPLSIRGLHSLPSDAYRPSLPPSLRGLHILPSDAYHPSLSPSLRGLHSLPSDAYHHRYFQGVSTCERPLRASTATP